MGEDGLDLLSLDPNAGANRPIIAGARTNREFTAMGILSCNRDVVIVAVFLAHETQRVLLPDLSSNFHAEPRNFL